MTSKLDGNKLPRASKFIENNFQLELELRTVEHVFKNLLNLASHVLSILRSCSLVWSLFLFLLEIFVAT